MKNWGLSVQRLFEQQTINHCSYNGVRRFIISNGLDICINRLIDLTRKWPAVTLLIFFLNYVGLFFNLVSFCKNKKILTAANGFSKQQCNAIPHASSVSKNEFIGDQNVTVSPNTFAKEDCFPSLKFVPGIYPGRTLYLKMLHILPRLLLPLVGCSWNGMIVRALFMEAGLDVHNNAHMLKKVQVKKKSTQADM